MFLLDSVVDSFGLDGVERGSLCFSKIEGLTASKAGFELWVFLTMAPFTSCVTSYNPPISLHLSFLRQLGTSLSLSKY